MSLEILFCESCNAFTLKTICSCGTTTTPPLPARFSVEDAYAKYRREAKTVDWKERELI